MLVLIGPSASGKTQIVRILIEKYQMKKLVTYTTRPMRINEVDGKDYHFITKEDFMKKIEQDFFLETVLYNGNYYGTSRSDLSNDKVVILEKQGLLHYAKEAKEQIMIIFLICAKPILEIRMRNRGDSNGIIQKRLAGDDEVFNDEVLKLADAVIDTSSSNIYDDANKIYRLYQKHLKDNKNANIG